jgi:N-dimethylarginine dimethylaminohydrolase
MPAAHYLMTDPAHYAVSYRINPWMRPDVWTAEGAALQRRAADASSALAAELEALGAEVRWAPAAPGLPDLVFPANAATVLDGKALLARFRCPERRGEEAVFRGVFDGLVERGVLNEIAMLPHGCFHEGAGDAIWDRNRHWFWTGWGQRSDFEAAAAIEAAFGRPTVPLQLISPRYYHLDTCFCPLAGGEVLYYPPAFTRKAVAAIRERVPAEQLIEASGEDAAAFCVNAVSLGRDIVMANPPPRLAARLAERGYRVVAVDLAPFILSGGAAFCMTLRLDLESRDQSKETSHGRNPHARAVA